MARLRWICVSDLHLGALNGLLTSVTDDGLSVDRRTPSSTTSALADCIYTLRRAQSEPPELVVLGDLFELALISTEMAAATFGQFVSTLRIGRSDAVVAPLVRFVPGNHDHRLWTQARDASYLEHLASVEGNDADLPEAIHATHLLPENDVQPVRDRFVELLATRADAGDTVRVHQSYPNLGMLSPDGAKAVVVSHGHFVEPLYRLMSNLDIAFGDQSRAVMPAAERLEASNAGWIDFFWSSMGDSGEVSGVVSRLYESLQSPEAMELEIKAIRRFVESSRGGLRGRLEARLLSAALRREVAGRLQRERHRDDPTLSPAAQAGLLAYLAGPVRNQLRRSDAFETTFVFGHTHKPFIESRTVEGYPNPVSILNTGGWVVDSIEPDGNKGASLVVVDDEANVAVVRVFIQGSDPSSYEVTVTSGDVEGANPLVDQLGSSIDSSRDPWKSLAEVLSASVTQRAAQLRDRLAAQSGLLQQIDRTGRLDRA